MPRQRESLIFTPESPMRQLGATMISRESPTLTHGAVVFPENPRRIFKAGH